MSGTTPASRTKADELIIEHVTDGKQAEVGEEAAAGPLAESKKDMHGRKTAAEAEKEAAESQEAPKKDKKGKKKAQQAVEPEELPETEKQGKKKAAEPEDEAAELEAVSRRTRRTAQRTCI